MPTARKQAWARPVARPITASDSRADLPDIPVSNGTISTAPN